MSRNRAALALASLVAALCLIGRLPTPVGAGIAAQSSGDPPAAKVDPRVLADTADGRGTAFLVLLAEQADLRAAQALRDPAARGQQVMGTLRSQADRSQASLRTLLDARGVRYRSFWIANALLVHSGDRALVDLLAARPDVRAIESDRPVRAIGDPPPPAGPPPARAALAAPEWGVQNVNAPAVWAPGFTGQGIVIGIQDTGMQWDHPALQPHYRGWNGAAADHNYNWHDAVHTALASSPNRCGYDSVVPCDDGLHGTHTTGTTTGDDGLGNQIGVAPGAKWIGCHNMDQGVGRPSTYTECFEFFAAPTDLQGSHPDPARRPHVISNSWACPPSEQCAPQTLQTVVENTQAAGIFVVVAAGNAGSACSTVSDPPALYAASFTVGATSIDNTVTGFSSRGPVTVDGSGRLKPDVVAPGANVRSAVPGNAYAALSGTSMAAPHVAGVVALLWSARPPLARDTATTRQVLQQTAAAVSTIACSSAGSPNNVYGYGRVDALAAVNGAPNPTPTPTSTATATPTPTAIPGDVNGDGLVDVRDYAIWRQQFGATDCGNPADLNRDCVVDVRDYAIWRQHFGQGAAAARPPLAVTTPPAQTPPPTPRPPSTSQ